MLTAEEARNLSLYPAKKQVDIVLDIIEKAAINGERGVSLEFDIWTEGPQRNEYYPAADMLRNLGYNVTFKDRDSCTIVDW
jgi:hypothetical protein